jgi:hypothetical protein
VYKESIMRNPIHMRTAQRAVDISGGAPALAAYLRVSPLVISGWIQGLEDVPPDTLLKLVDIVLGDERSQPPAAISDWAADGFKHRHAANT